MKENHSLVELSFGEVRISERKGKASELLSGARSSLCHSSVEQSMLFFHCHASQADEFLEKSAEKDQGIY